MARTDVPTIRLSPGDVTSAIAETAIAINPAGMRVVVGIRPDHVALRITNTHTSPHAVTIVGVPGAGNPRGQYGAAGPGGSFPAEPDYAPAAIPANTGVIWLAPPSRYFRPDGCFWLNFEAGHTGTVSAIEWS